MNSNLIIILKLWFLVMLFYNIQLLSQSDNDALLLFNTRNYAELKAKLEKLKETNAQIKFVYPPNLVIARLDQPIAQTRYAEFSIEKISHMIEEPEAYDKYGKGIIDAIFAYNNNFKGLDQQNELTPADDFKDPYSLIDDMLIPDKSTWQSTDSPRKPYGAGFWDVSEYMTNSISVTVILPESDGSIQPSTENWDASREANVASKIQAALNWWNNRFADVNLTFVMHLIYGRTNSNAQTGYEPISNPSDSDHVWINEIMSKFGYSSGNKFYRTTSFINDKIEEDGTEWGTIVFVADSYIDSDGRFADPGPEGKRRFAYAYLGGPYLVMTYKNNGYGIANMDAVMAHEFGHIFYALDEYRRYDNNGNYLPFSQLPAIYKHSGYYDIQNTNYEDINGNAPEASIMRGQIAPYSAGTVSTPAKHMIAWRDTDGDHIIDVLDTEPITYLNPVPPTPITQKLLGGHVNLNPLNNQNPWSSSNDITTNTAGVEARYDGLFWFDGNIINEDNDFMVGPFPDGVHTINVRAKNSVGNVDPTPETFTANFQTHFKSLSTTALAGNSARKIWSTHNWNPEGPPGQRVVYEDNGDIYYLEYWYTPIPPNYYWTNEVLLSDGSGNNQYPCISAYNGTGEGTCVVWQKYDPSQNRHQVIYREKFSGFWGDPVILSTTSTAADPQPVVASSYQGYFPEYDYRWHFVWNNGSGLKYATAKGSVVYEIADIPGSGANSRNPTIPDIWTHSIFGIAWNDGGQVYYQEVYYPFIGSPFDPSGSPLKLSNVYCGLSNNQTPSLAFGSLGKDMMLAWCGYLTYIACDDEDKMQQGHGLPVEGVGDKYVIVARHRNRDTGQWGNPRYISYSPGPGNLTPTVGYDGGDYRLIWKIKDQDKLARLDYIAGQGWQSDGQI